MTDWLLEIIQCPHHQEPLRIAETQLVLRLVTKFQRGELMNRLGMLIEQPFDSGLVNLSQTYFYPMRDGIPTLIAGEAIPLSNIE